MKKNSIIRSSFNYTVIQYLVMGIGFIKGMYVAKTITPALLGSYGLIVLVMDYLRFSHLGLFSAMNLEVSVHMGETDKKEYIQKIINNAFGYLVYTSGFFFLLAVFVKTFLTSFVAEDIVRYIYAIWYIAAIDQLKTFTIVYARLHEKYHLINRVELWSNVLLCLLVFAFLGKYQFTALIASMVASSTLLFVMCLYVIRNHVRPVWEMPMIMTLIRIGAPLLLYNICEKIFTTIDRFIIVRYLTRDDLGYFTLSSTILSSTMVLLSSFTFLYYPKVLKKFNLQGLQTESFPALIKDMQKYTKILGSVATGIGMTGIFLITPFIRIFLAKYESSILLYQIMMLGIMADSVTYFASTFLISNKHQKHLITLLLLVSIINGGLNFLAAIYGWGLAGIAFATATSMSLYALGKVLLCLHKMEGLSFANAFEFFKKYLLLVVFLVPVLVWFPSYIYVALPVFLLIYLPEYKEVLKKFKLETISK